MQLTPTMQELVQKHGANLTEMSYNTVHWRTLSTWPRGTALSPTELALAFLPLFARTPTSNPGPLALVTQPNLLPSTVWGLWYQVPCS